ncbi:MAG: hypothetical protein LC791_11125 [Acidobacteria bacterium]|nr:hypothetical protein [Acidobacteriota bacterium]
MIVVRLCQWVARTVFFLLIGATCWPATAAASSADVPFPSVQPNDNLRAAGTLDGGTPLVVTHLLPSGVHEDASLVMTPELILERVRYSSDCRWICRPEAGRGFF